MVIGFSRCCNCCVGNAGTYRNETGIAIQSPAGVNPAYHTNTYYSDWRSVQCGVARAERSVEQGEVTLTLLEDGTVHTDAPNSVRTKKMDAASLREITSGAAGTLDR